MEPAADGKKKKNSFKFQGFNEHKERIKVALLHNQLFPIQLESDVDTKCAAALEKWTNLNATAHYTVFRREVDVFVQSLEILVLHKNDVIGTFKEALANSTVEALQPIMEFGVALCLDLSEDMLLEFGPLVGIYTGLLSQHAGTSPQALEYTFTGLSYTMYALRRQLRRQPEAAATDLKPLLMSGGHVTELAAESFAFLLRKLPSQQQLLARIIALLSNWLTEASTESGLAEEAVAASIFYWLRGASGQLATAQFDSIYPLLLDWLGDGITGHANCLALLHNRLFGHLRRGGEAGVEVIRRLLLDRLSGAPSSASAAGVSHLVSELLEGGKGNLLAGGNHWGSWCRSVENLLARLPDAWSEPLGRLAARLIGRATANPVTLELGRCVFDGCCLALGDWRQRLEFACLVGADGDTDCLNVVMPIMVKASAEALQVGEADVDYAFSRLGSFCVANCRPIPAEAFEAMPEEERLLDWDKFEVEEKLYSLLGRLIDKVSGNGSFQNVKLALYCSFLPYSNLRNTNTPKALALWKKMVNLVVERTSADAPLFSQQEAHSLYRCVYALLTHAGPEKLSPLLPALARGLSANLDSPLYWKALEFLTAVVGVNPTDQMDLLSIRAHAMDRLVSASHTVRLHSLRLLSRLLESSEDQAFSRCLSNSIAAESLPVGLESMRECLRLLEDLNAERVAGLTENASTLCCRYLIGLLRVQFTPLWSAISRLLAGHGAVFGGGSGAFWTVMAPALETANTAAASSSVQSEDVPMEPADKTEETEAENYDCLDDDAKRLTFGLSNPSLERLDSTTYRLQLWQCLRQLSPQLIAKRTAITSPLILNCLRQEFCPSPRREPWSIRRRCQATLVAMLELYSGLGKAIKCVSGEAELHRWYYDLLQCPGSQVRKASLLCILAYGDKTLTTKSSASDTDWVAFLNRLADWRSTKEALISVGGQLSARRTDETTDETTGQTGIDKQDRQRQAVLAIAMRLLLGRVRTGGAGGGGGHLQCVFAFLADCCRADERRSFLNQLLFDQFDSLTLDSVESLVIDEDVSLGRLQAASKCALLVLSSMQLDPGQLCQVYSLLLCFNALLPKLAASASGGHVLSQLKGFRQLCQKGILRAFETNCQLPEQLVTATFRYCVLPHLEKLPVEASTATTPGLPLSLMRLWSTDNRHDHLLEGVPVLQLSRLLEASIGRRCSEAGLLVCLEVLNNLAEAQLPEEDSDVGQKLARPHYLIPVADSLATFVSNRLAPGILEAAPEVSRETLRLLALLVDNGLYRAELCERLAGAVLRLLLMAAAPAVGKGGSRLSRRQRFLRDDEFQARLLAALLTLLRRANTPCRALFLQAFSLFSKLNHRSSRLLLCQIADEAVRKLSLTNQPLGELACDLNAWDKRHVDAPDFERRECGHRAAFGAITSNGFATWPGLLRSLETVLVSLHCALHTLASVSDGPLRLLASDLLQSVVAGLAALDRADQEHEARGQMLNLLLWRAVWPAIAQGMKMDESRRVEYIALFGKVVQEFGHHARLKSIAQLAIHDISSSDTFFDNVRSVNTARVVKGFRQLISFLSGPLGVDVPPGLLYNYLLPLPMYYLRFAIRGSSAKQPQQQNSRRSLVEAALELLGGISAHLPWSMLRQLLKLCLKGLDGPPTESKLPIRLAVSALSGLGQISDSAVTDLQNPGSNKRKIKYSEQSEMDVDVDANKESNGDKDNQQPGAEALTFLIEFVCPKLERHLARDKTATEQQHRLAPRQEPQVLQVSVAVALAQLLSKLPQRLRDQRLPRLIYRIADFLRSREHAVRKEAGATLIRAVQLLGNEYVGFIARELSLLLAKGYTRHVLAHTLHILLRHCQQDMQPGCLDGETLERLCRIYMDELLGDLAKEKEVEALTRKLPEAQRVHAYTVMHRLGGLVGSAGLAQLVNILADQCAKVRSVAALRKLERVCSQLERVDSLPGNTALTPEQLLTAAHLLCRRASESSKDSKAVKPEEKDYSGSVLRARDSRLLDPEPVRGETRPSQIGSYHVLLRFGLRLLYAVLRNSSRAVGGSEAGSQLGRRMLDPFVPILLESLESQHTAVLQAALQCLGRLVPFHQLATAAAAAPSAAPLQQDDTIAPLYCLIAKRVLVLFNEQSLLWSTRQQLQQPSQLQQLLHRTLAVLVRHDAMQQADLVTLVDYIALDLDSPHKASHAFPLLKAILAKRLDPKPQRRHELDVETERDHSNLRAIMESLKRLVVNSALDYVRAQSRDCLLAYLRDYNLPAKVVRRYLDFFLVQLDYELSDGRASAVQMLAALIHSMSEEYLRGDLCQLLFLRLLVAGDNESNAQLRARITDCLHGLLRRCGTDQRRELFAIALRLLRSVRQGPQHQWVTQKRLGLTASLAFFEFSIESQTGAIGVVVASDSECWATAELHESLLSTAEELAPEHQPTSEAETEVVNNKTEDSEAMDHALFRCIDMLGRTLPHSAEDSVVNRRLWPLFEQLLDHRFGWVRRRCLQLITLRIIATENLAGDVNAEKEHYRRLSFSCFDQLKSSHLDEDWADDIGRLIVHLCCRMRRIESTGHGQGEGEVDSGFSAQWLLLRLGRESLYELQNMRPSTIRRRLALKTCAGVFGILGPDTPPGCLRRALAVAARELRQRDPQPAVLELAHDLLDACRRAVGEAAVAAGLAQLERSRTSAKSERAGRLSAAAVTQPELFAQRKRRKQRKKAEAAKAKVAKFKAIRRGTKRAQEA